MLIWSIDMCLLDLIDSSAERVLEIDGCGDDLVRALKARGAHKIFGATMVLAPLDEMDRWYDGFSDCRAAVFAPWEGRFDAIVCHQLLESVQDPLACVRRLRSWLSPNGHIVGRVANHGCRANVQSLIAGNLTYGSQSGLQSHQLRLYTRRELEKLAYRAWLDPEVVQGVCGSERGEFRLPDTVAGVASDDAVERFAFRFRPLTRTAYPLTSIIVVTWNELRYTRQCVQSIVEFTDEPFELIFVDNGSIDGTVEYLHSIPGARLIRNANNRGFPAAVNQGIEIAHGRQILLLNNDCIVTTGWLRRMLDALYSDDRIGLVGPCTNYTAGRQCIGLGYDSLSDLDGFAWQRAQRHAALRLECSPLCGFCLLARRTVIERIGGLDERFGLGTCDDDDLCARTERAGYRLVAACDAYVHHFGSRTFLGAGVDVSSLYARNKQLLVEKWDRESELASDQAESRGPQSIGTPIAAAVACVERGFAIAEQCTSKLSSEALAVRGMTSIPIRHFLNSVCEGPACSYLEVGCFRGATLIAASYGNSGRFIGVDNFCQFSRWNVRDVLTENLKEFAAECHVTFIERDCWDFASDHEHSSVNVFFYDGGHSHDEQSRAITLFSPLLQDPTVLIVDDWNEESVREGTRDGLKAVGWRIHQEWAQHTGRNGDSTTWWNGLFVAVIGR